MNVITRMDVPWEDGAVLLLKRVSKQRADEIAAMAKKQFVKTLDEQKEEEIARLQLKEKTNLLDLETDVDKIEAIKRECNALRSIANKTAIQIQSYINLTLIEESICGWTGIQDQDGNELPFNPDNRSLIWSLAMTDESVMDKMIIFIKGKLGNLKAGSIAHSNINGTSDAATDASKNV